MPRHSHRRRRIDFHHLDIPTKANRILHFILIALLLIVIRIWHLSVIQYESKFEQSQRSPRKSLIEPATRATIRDRFNLPLAINKISYQATILYSQLKEIPSIAWETDPETGKRKKIFKRKAYIRDLSVLLGKELGLDPDRIEDLIHAKASYYSQVPFVIKENLNESEYYRLKMYEKDWPGILVRHVPKRYYPKGKVGADLIGYMGAINRQEYEKILHEMKALEQFIQERESGEEEHTLAFKDTFSARRRLKDLQAKAYTIHDYVGKTGIEGVYEEQLRGFYGKKNFYTDSKGNFLRELPGSRFPLTGHRILLTLSSELQEYAEKLLAQNEEVRITRESKLGNVKHTVLAHKSPWIKGGAIVAIEPTSGEVIALASYPRFDPNDFILSGDAERQKEKKRNIHRWFENEVYIGLIWDQQHPLKRERYETEKELFYDEEKVLTWSSYLDFILPSGNIRKAIGQIETLNQSIELQKHIKQLQDLFPDYSLYTLFNFLYNGDDHESYRQNLKGEEKQKFITLFQELSPSVQKIKLKLDPFLKALPHNYDKVLLVDLCRLAVDENRFSSELLQKKGNEKISTFHNQQGSLAAVLPILKEKIKNLFHETDFKEWRMKEEKNFLKQKREEEKLSKSYPKPYIDYLDQKENEFFKVFWESHCWKFLIALLLDKKDSVFEEINPYLVSLKPFELGDEKNCTILRNAIKSLSPEMAIEYLNAFRSFEQLNRPLFGHYRYLRKDPISLEKHLAAAFYPTYGFGYGRSHAYRQSAIQGSLFKLVTAYEAIVQRFRKMGQRVTTMKDLNPLVIVDEVFQLGGTRYVGYTAEGKAIPQLYKGGRLPRSLAHQHNGRVDFFKALEVSSNPYFSLLAAECLDEPEDLSKAASLFSFGNRTGIELPYEIKGKVPNDLKENKTGLYAMAIGQHSLVVTPLQTSIMLSAIANGGKVLKPKIVKLTAGRLPSREDEQILCLPTFPYQDALSYVGIDFPLFTSSTKSSNESLIKVIPTEVKWEIFMPNIVRLMLLKGLNGVSQRTYQDNLKTLTLLYQEHPEAIADYKEVKDQLLGKTSTSEAVENIDLDLDQGTNIYTHVWFGSIGFQKGRQNKNILVFKDEFGEPELVVVVYLRYGGYGKEAAPIAAQIFKKWREIKQKYQAN